MKKTLQYLQRCLGDKNKRIIEILNSIGDWTDLEPSMVNIAFKTLPVIVSKSGDFFVVTGTKESPSGIGNRDLDFIFLYSKDNGVGSVVPVEALIDLIKKERDSIKIGIDDEYKKMGVWMNIGMLTSFLDEDFVSALLPSFELGSSTETHE